MGDAPPFADPGTPDTRGPGRYLWWLVKRQPARVLAGGTWASISAAAAVLTPAAIQRAIDDGLTPRDGDRLLLWLLAVLGLSVVFTMSGIMRHRTMTFARLDAGFRTIQVVTRHIGRVGAALTRRVSSGEVVSIGTTDVNKIAETMTVTGPGVAAVVAFVLISVLLLSVSMSLGALVLIGLPVGVVALTPVLNRLRRREGAYRERQGTLTARAGDIVAGLRVLRGVGGEDQFAARYRHHSAALRTDGYRVASVISWVKALQTGGPGAFLAVVVWLAARQAAAGTITIGEMVAVYGYAALLVMPTMTLVAAGQWIIHGLVGAGRVVDVLTVGPDVHDAEPAVPTVPGPEGPADLYDPPSGLIAAAGALTVIAADDTKEVAAVADRLGRYVEADATLGDVPLRDMALSEVRRRVLVAEHDAFLFAGPLRDIIIGGTAEAGPDMAADTLMAAVRVAAADDIVAGLPDGLDTLIDTSARTLSGGQRQRVRLARAVAAEPEALILLDPTSAVDAHTEAAIAERLRAARAGRRVTVVSSTSPLWLDRADTVAWLVDGKVAATGSHAELLATRTGYRQLVTRGGDEPDDDGEEKAVR